VSLTVEDKNGLALKHGGGVLGRALDGRGCLVVVVDHCTPGVPRDTQEFDGFIYREGSGKVLRCSVEELLRQIGSQKLEPNFTDRILQRETELEVPTNYVGHDRAVPLDNFLIGTRDMGRVLKDSVPCLLDLGQDITNLVTQE